MKTESPVSPRDTNPGLSDLQSSKWYRLALILAMITIAYNLIEGLVSVWFGFNDETLALFGFGLDSFIEVLSGVGILHMVNRLRKSPTEKQRDHFETLALRITGTAFIF